MKYLLHIIIIVFLIAFTSCSEEDPNLDDQKFSNNELVCLPYIESELALQDISTIPVDPSTSIVAHRQEGDCLFLDTRFGGGCEEHLLQLIIDLESSGAINLSESYFAILSHDNTDQCEAIVALEVGVDISKLIDLGKEEVVLTIDGYSELVTITF